MNTLLTLWTIRLSLLCLSAGMAGWLVLGGRPGAAQRRLCWVWTVGCGLSLAHLACAFHYYHDWRHADAVRHTEAQTQAVLGWEFGQGVIFNYLFVAVWVADCAVLWSGLGAESRARARWRRGASAYLAFIAWNATVVFESGAVRWSGLAVTVALAIVWILTRRARVTVSRTGGAA